MEMYIHCPTDSSIGYKTYFPPIQIPTGIRKVIMTVKTKVNETVRTKAILMVKTKVKTKVIRMDLTRMMD
jgi:hypothetical protein